MGLFGKSKEEKLLDAAQSGDVEKARAALDAGANRDCTGGEYGRTPLSYAAYKGHAAVVRLLLERGAVVNSVTKGGGTPLHNAACIGHLECTRLLLERGADKDAKDKYGWTPLHWAAYYSRLECCRLLLERGADKEAKTIEGKTPLEEFSQQEDKSDDSADTRAVKAAIRALLMSNSPPQSSGINAAQAKPAEPAAPAHAPAAPAHSPAAGLLRPSGPKVALCIGISGYESPLNKLANPVHDAGDVAAALKRVGYDTITLFDRAATKKGMRQALETFSSRLGRGGVAFFFFAGHGMTGLDGKNYLLPVNGIDYIEDLEDDALSLEKVGSLLAYSCDLGKTAADGEGRNGAFTTALLRHLTTPELHVENVFTRAARDCQELTKHHAEPQKPWKAANLTHEHVCLF